MHNVYRAGVHGLNTTVPLLSIYHAKLLHSRLHSTVCTRCIGPRGATRVRVEKNSKEEGNMGWNTVGGFRETRLSLSLSLSDNLS